MPKEKTSSYGTLKQYEREFSSEHFTSDGQVLYCQACEKTVNASRRSQVTQHISTSLHEAAKRDLRLELLSQNRL